MFFITPAALVVTVAASLGLLVNAITKNRRRSAIASLLLDLACWVTAIAMLILDPAQVVSWFLD